MPATHKQRKLAIVGSRSVGENDAVAPFLIVLFINEKKKDEDKDEMGIFGGKGLIRSKLGKSSLTVRFVDGVFIESYYPTIENTFSKTIKHRGQEFLTEIVDTAGQVR